MAGPGSLPPRPLFDRDDPALAEIDKIVAAVRDEGLPALLKYRDLFDTQTKDSPLIYERIDLERSLDFVDKRTLDLLQNVAARVRLFATAQLACLTNLDIQVPGGRAGHRITPLSTAGCYAPGGRYPLPSSILMTVIPAVVAGVNSIWVATPDASPVSLAAAYIAGAQYLVSAGGAHAVAAMAYGAGPVPPCDVIVGPGNKYVTAAKRIVSGDVRIDMLAGPSELVVLADSSSNPEWIAADLIAQAEHDPDALPILISTDAGVIERVEGFLGSQLQSLSTSEIARTALSRGGALQASSRQELAAWCNELVPEHVQICTTDPQDIADSLTDYGALFIGNESAEVFGDYGIGPNHTLPTHGAGRRSGGLSVFDFVKVQTWLQMEGGTAIDDTNSNKTRTEDLNDNEFDRICVDSAQFASLEGLRGHEAAALLRKKRQ